MTVLCIPHAQDLVRGGPGCVVCVLEADNERLRGLYNTATLEREAAWRREDERRSRLAELVDLLKSNPNAYAYDILETWQPSDSATHRENEHA